MIELYGMKSPNVLKVVLALEEMELPYEIHPIDVWGGQQYSPEYLAINPNNKVPAIVDTDGPVVTISEVDRPAQYVDLCRHVGR